MFGQPLSGFEPADPVWAGHTFKGWYKDSDCTMEFDFANTIMTANTNLVVYAKWESDDYKVNFYDGVELLGAQGVADGQPVNFNNLRFNGVLYDSNLHSPIKGAFNGWSYYPADSSVLSPYPLDLLVYHDLNLFVNWRATGFKVDYTAMGAGSGSVAPEDRLTYGIGSYARVMPGPQIYPPGQGLIFIGWRANGYRQVYYPHSFLPITGDLTLHPYIVGEANTVLMTFDENYGANPARIGLPVEKDSSVKLPGETIFFNSRPGFTLLGWQDTPGDPPKDGAGAVIAQYPIPDPGIYNIGGSPVTLYAVWDSSEYTIRENYVDDYDRNSILAPGTSTRLDGGTGYNYTDRKSVV
jgi:uncharacterized repeat protein (TIGR02543 family)